MDLPLACVPQRPTVSIEPRARVRAALGAPFGEGLDQITRSQGGIQVGGPAGLDRGNDTATLFLFQELIKVHGGARTIAHLELHGGSHGHHVAHGHRALGPVRSQHAPDQEVAALELEPSFVDHDPAVQSLGRQLAILG